MLSSVPQGLVLGPCLFLLYTNDLHELPFSNVRLFVDDTITYLTTDSELESCPLQNDLERQKLNGSKFGINARSSVRGGPKRWPVLHDCILYGQSL